TGRPVEECERVLRVIQALEPVGVGARDLRECLLIQLEARNERDTLPWRLIHDQFDNLVNRRFPEIARQLRCSVEEVQGAADTVATLNPKPGLQVSSEDPKYVVPDLIVERVDDEYVVSRVCSGKYVQTPRGVFELKFYFSSGLETEDGEDVSARTAKDIIKTLIEEEDRKEPLSDQRIAELLHEKGLRIARRTVAK